MGLFGGFKAKFTKDSTAKSASKSSKKSEVVCLGYRVYSEFQEPPQSSQPLPAIRKRPSGVKTVPSRIGLTRNGPNQENHQAGPSTATPVETRIITNPKMKKSANKLPTSPTITPVVHDIPQQEVDKSKGIRAQKVNASNGASADLRIKSSEKLESPYVVGKTSSFNPISASSSTNHINIKETEGKEATKSILKSKSAFELSTTSNHDSDTRVDLDDETTVLTSTRKKQTTTTQHIEYSSKIISQQSIQKDNDYSYRAGYTAHSSRALGNTSSYAANIFFGGDEEPEIQRPRKINLADQDGANSQSAEC